MRSSLNKVTAAEATAARQLEDAIKRVERQVSLSPSFYRVGIPCSGTSTTAKVPLPSATPGKTYTLVPADVAGITANARAVVTSIDPGTSLSVTVLSTGAMSGTLLFTLMEA